MEKLTKEDLLQEIQRLNETINRAVINMEGVTQSKGPFNLQGRLKRNGKYLTWLQYWELKQESKDDE